VLSDGVLIVVAVVEIEGEYELDCTVGTTSTVEFDDLITPVDGQIAVENVGAQGGFEFIDDDAAEERGNNGI
jgi:hypothetical protein